MKLEGSCHCGAVRFSVESRTPYPYLHCYCSICRKTQGGRGYAINIMGEAKTLRVRGRVQVAVYRAMLDDEKRPGRKFRSPARPHFCRECGSGLWLSDPRWPQWVYPFASAVDTPLPPPPERTHIMLDSRAGWVRVPRDAHFPAYPDEAIAGWHRRRGLRG